MTGPESQIPGTWKKTEHAYPQIEYFSTSEHGIITDNSRVSVVALELPGDMILSDLLNAGEIILPQEVDGQAIQWDGEGGIRIEEGNQIRMEETVTVTSHDVPVVGTALVSNAGVNSESDMETKQDMDLATTSQIRLKASVGEGIRSYALTAKTAKESYSSWLDVGAKITTPPPTANASETPGTETNPYLLDSAEDLAWFAVTVNAGSTNLCATLTADIDLFGKDYTGEIYNPDDLSNGLVWKSIDLYKGIFDGGNHAIKNLHIDGSVSGSDGLFRHVSRGTIKNLGVESGYVDHKKVRKKGLFIAVMTEGTVLNCWNKVDILNGTGEVGTFGSILGLDDEMDVVFDGCYNFGDVSGTPGIDCGIGGIAGKVWAGPATSSVIIRNCYNFGRIDATDNGYAGGIVGNGSPQVGETIGVFIENCYNVGEIVSQRGNAIRGATSSPAKTINSYYDVNTSGKGDDKATALTTAQMQTWAFAYKLNENSLNGVWQYNKDAYPTFGSLVPFDWEKAGEALEYGFFPADKTKPTGDGTPDKPYQIKDAEQLAWFAWQVNNVAGKTDTCAILMNDLNLQGASYTETGTGFLLWTPIRNYSGTFGTDNVDIYEVSGLHIDTATASATDSAANTGLFGAVTGTIARTAVVDSALKSSGGNQGAITGLLNGGTIYQCYSRNNVGTGAGYAGGIAGRMTGTSAQIRDCYNIESRLAGSGAASAAGGIAGDGSAGSIQNCYSVCLDTGTITAGGTAGSIAGKTGGSLAQCYSNKTLSDSSQVIRFDTTSDAKRREQTAGLNTYENVEREGADRIWYTSLTEEKTKGYPTFQAPEILSVTLDPSKVTETGGALTGAAGVWSGGTLPSTAWFRGIIPLPAADEPVITLVDKATISSNFHTYGSSHAHTNLALTAGDQDLAVSAGSLTAPSVSIGNVLTLYNGAAYHYPSSRKLLLEAASRTGIGENTKVMRYEVMVEIAGVKGKKLVVDLKTSVPIVLEPGVKGTAYTEDISLSNANAYPLQMKISSLSPIIEGKDTTLKTIGKNDEIHMGTPLKEDGVKLGITKPETSQDTGKLEILGDIYYEPGADGAAGTWMKGSLGAGDVLWYRYFIKYSPLHIGPEQTFGFKITYDFQIPSEDQGAGVDVSAG